MKVVATVDYNDLQLKRGVKKGETLDVAEARAEVLIAAKVAEKSKRKKSDNTDSE